MNISKGVLDVTINQVSGLVSWNCKLPIAIVFAVYILANERRSKSSSQRILYAPIPEERL